jgi:hypothetical protein
VHCLLKLNGAGGDHEHDAQELLRPLFNESMREDCKRLADVDFPIALTSSRSARQKSIGAIGRRLERAGGRRSPRSFVRPLFSRWTLCRHGALPHGPPEPADDEGRTHQQKHRHLAFLEKDHLIHTFH